MMAGSVRDNTRLHNWYYRWSIVSLVNSAPQRAAGRSIICASFATFHLTKQPKILMCLVTNADLYCAGWREFFQATTICWATYVATPTAYVLYRGQAASTASIKADGMGSGRAQVARQLPFYICGYIVLWLEKPPPPRAKISSCDLIAG